MDSHAHKASIDEEEGVAYTQPGDLVFRARGVTKLYRTGDVDVQALRDVDLDLFAGVSGPVEGNCCGSNSIQVTPFAERKSLGDGYRIEARIVSSEWKMRSLCLGDIVSRR